MSTGTRSWRSAQSTTSRCPLAMGCGLAALQVWASSGVWALALHICNHTGPIYSALSLLLNFRPGSNAKPIGGARPMVLHVCDHTGYTYPAFSLLLNLSPEYDTKPSSPCAPGHSAQPHVYALLEGPHPWLAGCLASFHGVPMHFVDCRLPST